MTTITPEHRQQTGNWRALVRLLAVMLFVTLASAGLYVRHNDDRQRQAEELVNCRSKVASALSSAQVDNDIAFNELVVALTDPTRRPFTVEIAKITDTGIALSAARDARVAFESHPTRHC